MVNEAVLVEMYVSAGALELTAVGLTAWDLRGKVQAARSYKTPVPAKDVNEVLLDASVKAAGGTTWGKSWELGMPCSLLWTGSCYA